MTEQWAGGKEDKGRKQRKKERLRLREQFK